MFEFKPKTKIKISTNKNFGIVFALFFLIVAIYKIFFFKEYDIIFILLFLIFIFFSFLYPLVFKYPNILWSKFGILIGLFISPLIMFIIYYVVFLPIGLLLRIIKKDHMNIQINKKIKTYWQKPDKKNSTMKNQF